MSSFGNFLKDRLSRKLNVFLVCLFISAIIWLLTSLSKSYTTEIAFPVEHRGIPEDRIVTDPLPDKLELKVHSHGFELLSYKLFSRQEPVQVDMKELRFEDPGTRERAYLPTEELLEDLSGQFPTHTRIRDVDPDTLFVSLTPRKEKEVKVVPRLELDFREQFRLAREVETTPSKVTLSGPASVLDTTHTIRTKLLELQDLHKDQELKVELDTDSISQKVKADPQEVKLRIRVNEYTEGQVKIPLKAQGVPERFVLKTYPDSVTVHYLVGFQNYEKVEEKMFKARVPFPEEQNGRGKDQLPVRLTDKPSFVDILHKEPERVEFIIRKKR